MKPYACRMILLAGFGLVGALSAVVISEDELEANKPQLAVSKNGNYLKIDWGSQPEVYYFIEVTNDFSSWVPIKLLKDYTGEGELVVEPAIVPPKAFYRLSLEGDPNSARLRADDDGDKIINLDEANKGWDHLTTPISEDTNFNGVPDYWEEFHYQSLDHDGTYIAVAGGLTMAQAYANATDPNSVDSDGDGWTDAQEIAWEWDPNYDQSRDDDKYSPFGDFDSDGVSNLAEALNNSDPTDSGDAPVFTSPFINKGDLGENLPNEKNLSFTLTSEQNGNYAFIVVVGSEEYDEFTGTTSEFNDRIEWTAKVDGVEVMNQTIDVNDLHADWVLAEQNMLAYPDFPADAHQPYIAQVLPLSVELEDTSTMEIIYESSVTNIGDGTLPSTVLLQLLKMEFVPRPGKVQSGFDAHSPGALWTSVPAGESSDVVRFHCPGGNSLKDVIKFKVEYPDGNSTLDNVNGNGELLDSVGGSVFELSGDYTDIPIFAKQHTSDGPKYADIVAMVGEGETATEAARLKVVILAERTLTVHLITVEDSTSTLTQNFTVPTMKQLTDQLDEIYKQAAINFEGGQTISRDIPYDFELDENGNKNGKLDPDPPGLDDNNQPFEGERAFLVKKLREYVQTNFEGNDPVNNSTSDFFVFYYAESAVPNQENVYLNDGTKYISRGGNITNGQAPPGIYGPFLEVEGFGSVTELSTAAAHEIGHSLNLPFNDTPLYGINKDVEKDPPINDELENTTAGHDNFNFPNPDSANDPSQTIWSLVRSGVFLGEEISFDEYSMWLRKIYWIESNGRALERTN